ncbi:unnamed protein product, partial [Callosobruchus maculatus]
PPRLRRCQVLSRLPESRLARRLKNPRFQTVYFVAELMILKTSLECKLNLLRCMYIKFSEIKKFLAW